MPQGRVSDASACPTAADSDLRSAAVGHCMRMGRMQFGDPFLAGFLNGEPVRLDLGDLSGGVMGLSAGATRGGLSDQVIEKGGEKVRATQGHPWFQRVKHRSKRLLFHEFPHCPSHSSARES